MADKINSVNGYIIEDPSATAHASNKSNPHGVTPNQIGTLTTAEINSLVSNGKSKFVKLWQNANGGSVFNTQDISLGDISQYDLFVLRASYRTNDAWTLSTVILPHEEYYANGCIFAPAGHRESAVTEAVRYFYIYRAGGVIHFYSAYLNGAGENSYIIPLELYGIKL